MTFRTSLRSSADVTSWTLVTTDWSHDLFAGTCQLTVRMSSLHGNQVRNSACCEDPPPQSCGVLEVEKHDGLLRTSCFLSCLIMWLPQVAFPHVVYPTENVSPGEGEPADPHYDKSTYNWTFTTVSNMIHSNFFILSRKLNSNPSVASSTLINTWWILQRRRNKAMVSDSSRHGDAPHDTSSSGDEVSPGHKQSVWLVEQQWQANCWVMIWVQQIRFPAEVRRPF